MTRLLRTDTDAVLARTCHFVENFVYLLFARFEKFLLRFVDNYGMYSLSGLQLFSVVLSFYDPMVFYDFKVIFEIASARSCAFFLMDPVAVFLTDHPVLRACAVTQLL